jgi:hypothetical protein
MTHYLRRISDNKVQYNIALGELKRIDGPKTSYLRALQTIFRAIFILLPSGFLARALFVLIAINLSSIRYGELYSDDCQPF